MPTGYTHQIIDGDGITPRQYLLSCARAFGAAVMQRDDPADAPLKTTREPSTYYRNRYDEARAELVALESMSETERANEGVKDLAEIVERNDSWHAAWIVKERRYDAMENAVQSWNPPSDEHEGLKKFALEQISISRSLSPLYVDTCGRNSSVWYEEKVQELKRDVQRYAAEYEKELKRCAEHTAWLTSFVESLPAEEEK